MYLRIHYLVRYGRGLFPPLTLASRQPRLILNWLVGKRATSLTGPGPQSSFPSSMSILLSPQCSLSTLSTLPPPPATTLHILAYGYMYIHGWRLPNYALPGTVLVQVLSTTQLYTIYHQPSPRQPHPLVPVITITIPIITPPVNTVEIPPQVILNFTFNAYIQCGLGLDSILHIFWIRGIVNWKTKSSTCDRDPYPVSAGGRTIRFCSIH